MRWSENDTLKFVKIYLRYEYLWNADDENYRQKHLREKAYLSIINQFRDVTDIVLTVPELKMKIKNLRSTYNQELVKIKQRSRPDFVYKPTMKWFAEYHKCLKGITRRRDASEGDIQEHDNEVELSVSPDNENEDIGEMDPFVETLGSMSPDCPLEEDYNLDFKPERKESFSQDSDCSDYKKPKVRQKHFSTDFSDGTYRGSLDSNSESAREDEFDIYGKYIASQLRRMDLQKAIRVQLEIQGIVSEARIASLKGH